MSRVSYVRYLRHEDAWAISRLERMVYPRRQRNGRRAIAEDLLEAEETDTNLSVGVFEGTKLVGFILAYKCANRSGVFDRFEVRVTKELDLTGSCIYVEDIVCLPGKERRAVLMNSKWQRELQIHASGLPLDAFCDPTLRSRWKQHDRLFTRKGLLLDKDLKVQDPVYGQDWYWMSWRVTDIGKPSSERKRLPGKDIREAELPDGYTVRLIQTEEDWALMSDVWDGIVDRMPKASGFLPFDFLYTWWRHNGISRHLAIIALFYNNKAVGFAPLMLAPKRILGAYRWRIEFIGDQVNMERPTMIVDSSDPSREELLWRSVLSIRDRWDAAYLREQTLSSAEHPIVPLTENRGYTLSQSPEMISPHVSVRDDWATYLANRSRSLRKSLRRKQRQLEGIGELEYRGYEEKQDGHACLNAYLDVEKRSWKHAGKVSIGSSYTRSSFYRELVEKLDSSGRIRFRFLVVDGRPIAATFGVYQNGRFASLEICHDQQFDKYSPGVVLTGYELEECHNAGSYTDYDFLIGTYNNKTTWGTDVHTAWNLYLLPDTAWGHVNRWLIFSLKPRIDALIERANLRDRIDRFLYRVEGYIR